MLLTLIIKDDVEEMVRAIRKDFPLEEMDESIWLSYRRFEDYFTYISLIKLCYI